MTRKGGVVPQGILPVVPVGSFFFIFFLFPELIISLQGSDPPVD